MDADRETHFEGWYEQTYPRIAGSVATMFGNYDVGEEAAAEAFARAYSRWNRVRDMASPEAWVHRVAVNVARRRVRRANLERSLLLRTRVPDEVVPAPQVPSEVWDAVAELPEKMRMAIVLRYVGDLRQADIASVMGVTPGTVAAHLHAGRRQLSSLLGLPHGAQKERNRG